MQTVTLLPKNRRLKGLITEHGSQWIVLNTMPVACFGGEVGIRIQSPDKTHDRWVRLTDIEV